MLPTALNFETSLFPKSPYYDGSHPHRVHVHAGIASLSWLPQEVDHEAEHLMSFLESEPVNIVKNET